MSQTIYNSKTTATTVARDLAQHVHGKTILITGVSPAGLGAQTALAIAPYKPALVILAGRSPSKISETAKSLEKTAPGIKTRALTLDLSSQKQIRQAAAEVNAYAEPIDVLVNNAGLMARPFEKSEDGIESQFATNHVGHFLFTNLIIGKVLQGSVGGGKAGRVVNVSSDGYRLSPIRFYDMNFEDGKTYDKWRAYGQSKTANILFSVSLVKKLGNKGLTSFSLHPGAINTTSLGSHLSMEEFGSLFELDRAQGHEQGWWDGFPFKTIDEGAATQVRAAFDPSIAGENGGHLSDGNVLPPQKVRSWARDEVEAEMLWEQSEKLVGQKFQY